MASICDALAQDFGEQREQHLPQAAAAAAASSDPAPSSGDLGKDLADRVVDSTGECGPCAKWSGPDAKKA